jgi:hypothetical protein
MIPALTVLLVLALGVSVPSFAASASDRSGTPKIIRICHGHGCARKTKLQIDKVAAQKFTGIMAGGKKSAEAERQAVSNAVQYFEKRSTAVIGSRDGPKSTFLASVPKGQMDCVDESTNTRSLLLYLEAQGLLKYHTVQRNVSRGFFADGRYPHFTAVLRDQAGMKWTVDSWYEPAGGPPDIWPLTVWKTRGVGGDRF